MAIPKWATAIVLGAVATLVGVALLVGGLTAADQLASVIGAVVAALGLTSGAVGVSGSRQKTRQTARATGRVVQVASITRTVRVGRAGARMGDAQGRPGTPRRPDESVAVVQRAEGADVVQVANAGDAEIRG